MFYVAKKFRVLLLSAFFVTLYSVVVTYGAPLLVPYNPGETLDPSCAPGEANCTVLLSYPSQIGNTGKILTTNGTQASWTDTPNIGTATGTSLDLGSGTVTSGLINGQTISSSANLTGTLAVAGNVGIGITNPDASLYVRRTTADSNYVANFFGSDSLNDGVNVAITNTTSGRSILRLRSGGSDRFWFGADGNLGIGTTNPSSKLEVSGDIRIKAGSGGQIIFADGSTMSSSGLGSAAALSSTTDAIVTGDSDANGSGDIILKTASNDRLHILNTGNVGINTATPSALFSVGTGSPFQVTNLGAVTGTSLDLGSGTVTSGLINGQTISSSANLTGTLAVAGVFSDTGFGTHTFSSGGTGYNELQVRNTTAGTGNGSALRLGNDATTSVLSLFADSSTLTPAGDHVASGATVRGAGAGGLILSATNAAGTVSFMTGGTTERMRIDASGNVGIGTTNPDKVLVVEGVSGAYRTGFKIDSFASTFGPTISGYTNRDGVQRLFWSGALIAQTDQQLYFGTAANFSMSYGASYAGFEFKNTAGNQYLGIKDQGTAGDFNFNNGKVFFANGGNVGIGTTAPALQSAGTGLHINDTTSSELKFTNSTTGLLATDGTALVSNGSDFTINNRENGTIRLNTNNAERVRIDSAGNVGVGTTNPSFIFQVDNTTNTDNGIAIRSYGTVDPLLYPESYSSTSAVSAFLSFRKSHQNTLGNTATIDGEDLGRLTWNGNSGSAFTSGITIKAVQNGAAGTNTPADLLFYTANGSTFTEKLRLTSAGNLGIGTTTPDSKFSVSGSVAGSIASIYNTNADDGNGLYIKAGGVNSGKYALAIDNNASANLLTVLANGSVGIGTVTPARIFTINGGANTSRVLLQNTTTGSSIGNGFDIYEDTSGVAGLWNYYNGAMQFATNNLERMRIDASGNVGIGTMTPGKTLEVNGNGYFNGTLSVGTEIDAINAFANQVFINSNSYLTDPTLNVHGIYGNVDISATSGAYTKSAYGIHGRLEIDAPNTQNWTANQNAGVYGEAGVATGASGTISKLAGLRYFVYQNGSSATVTNMYGILGTTLGGGPVTNYAGIALSQLTATNSTGVLVGTSTIPTGNYGIYDMTGFNSYFSGNVGIGTSAPVRNLHIDGGASNAYLMLGNTASGATVSDGLQLFTTGINATISNRENGFLSFETNNTEKVRIDSAGNMGIGTTSPGAPLTVLTKNISGSLYSGLRLLDSVAASTYWDIGASNVTTNADLRFAPNGATPAVVFSATGNVGIGTTAPGQKLDVVGADGDGIQYRTSTRAIGIGQQSGEPAVYWGSGTPLTFTSGGSERLRIDSSGAATFTGALSATMGTFTRPVYAGTNSANYTVSMGGSGGDYGSVGYGQTYTSTTGVYNYRATDFSSMLKFQLGGFQFNTAPSGTAGNPITYTQRAFLQNDGTFTLGSTNGVGTGALYAGTGTFTGALNGTTGNFSGTLDAQAVGGQISISGGGTKAGLFMSSSNSLLKLADWNTGLSGLTIDLANSGAATFSSSVGMQALTATSGTFSGQLTTLGDIFITGASKSIVFNSAVNFNTQIYESSGALLFNTGGNTRLTLSSGGAATFAGSIAGTSANFSSAVTVTANGAAQTLVQLGRASDNIGYQAWYNNAGTVRYGYIQAAPTNGGQLSITADGGGQLILDSSGVSTGYLITASSGISIPNGSYYKANRTTGGASINVLGIESGTDNTVMVASNYFKIRNTGTGDSANLFTVDTSGNGVLTGGLTTSGTVGFGISNPADRLVVRGLASNAGMEFGNTAGGVNYLQSYDRVASAFKPFEIFASGVTATAYFDSTGNVGIGTATPDAPLHANGGTAMTSGWNRTATLEATFPTMVFNSASNRWAGIGYDYSATTAGMSFWVYATSNDVTNTGSRVLNLKNNGTISIPFYGAGTLTTDASGNVTASSDERLKDLGGSYSAGLTQILGINPILYHWNSTSGYDTATQYAGFSAQNVQTVIPEAVGIDPRGYLTLSDRPILAAVVNAIKELDVKIAPIPVYTDPDLINKLHTFLTDAVENSRVVIDLVNAKNIITDTLNAGTVETKSLCVSDDTGAKTCVTKSQLDSLLQSLPAQVLPPPAPAPTATCTDGILNQDETAIDTGGVCTPPPSDPGPAPEPAPEPIPDPVPEP